MRLIHTSDLHLGSALSSRFSPEAARVRRLELQQTLYRLADEAERQGCDGIIIAGDLFDTDNPSALDKELFLSTVRRHSEILFFYLQGNHDESGLGKSNLPKNLYLFGDDYTEYKIGEVSIVGKTKLGSNAFDNLKLNSKRKNIVVLHGAVGSSSGEGIRLADASHLGIDYLALGHYHKFSQMKIDGRATAVYSGTPEGRGFDESHTCGYVLIDTDGKLTYSFVPFAKRTVLTITVDISSALKTYDVESLVKNSIKEVHEDSVVRVVLSGQRHKELIYDSGYLCNMLGSRFFHFEIVDESSLKIERDELKYDKSLSGEFLRLCSEAGLSADDYRRVVELGLRALRGDKIE